MGCGCKKRKISQPKKAPKVQAQKGGSQKQARIIKRVRRVTK